MAIINISGLDKAEVLFALYNGSKVQGLGYLQAIDNYTLEQAQEDYDNSASKYFDYLHGRVMKVQLDGDSFDSWGYDRDNGEGAALNVITKLRNRTIEKSSVEPSLQNENLNESTWSERATDYSIPFDELTEEEQKERHRYDAYILTGKDWEGLLNGKYHLIILPKKKKKQEGNWLLTIKNEKQKWQKWH